MTTPQLQEQPPVTILVPWVQFMDRCPKCGLVEIFLAGWECAAGLLGYCVGCGHERIAPFTHTNSEVA